MKKKSIKSKPKDKSKKSAEIHPIFAAIIATVLPGTINKGVK